MRGELLGGMVPRPADESKSSTTSTGEGLRMCRGYLDIAPGVARPRRDAARR